MSAREIPDPDIAPLGGDAQARAFQAARDEAASRPSTAQTFADLSGRYFHWACASCRRRGFTCFDKAEAQAESDRHNEEAHS